MKDNTIQSNVYELDISDSIKNYWKSLGRKSSDFYCRNCGRFLLDIDESLKGEDVRTIRESLANRNLIVGRNFSGKQFFRVLCWDCFHAELKREVEEDSKKLKADQRIKHTWRQRLLRGELDNYYPVPSQSATFYFKFLFDMTDEELKNECDKFITASPDFFKRKYGDDWQRKFNDYRKLQSRAGCSLDYFIEKFGEEEGQRRYRQVSNSKAVTLDNSIEKYGDAGKGLFKQYCEKQRNAGCSLEYFQHKYGDKEGREEYQRVNSLKAITQENMERVHGIEKGRILYDNWKRKGMQKRSRHSEVSQQLFKMIDDKLGDFAVKSKWAEKNAEELVILPNGNIYQLDYSIGNKVIEFNGDFWHMNPSIYSSVDYNSALCCYAKDKWDMDAQRIKDMKEFGYEILVVWESEYRLHPDMVLSNCCKFINPNFVEEEFSIFDL